MKYIIAANYDFSNVKSYCEYEDTVECSSGSGHGGGNYLDVEVGI